ncbi:glycosyltransferase [Candidatus Pelagibacter bacterium]|nr:glycosyltransferase [Candidatus Pelagibacter bacterium]
MITDITIIFVLYKSDSIIFENLKNLKNFKKIIIDNDPTSTIKDQLLKFDDNIIYHKMDKNIGMGRAANFAFDMVKSNYILYLTADTIMNENNVLNLKKIFNKYDNVGLVCPNHFDDNDKYIGNYFCHPLKRLEKRNTFEKKIYNSLSKIKPSGDFFVESVWGAPIMLKTDIIKKIGFFDPNFFMYFEDVELCDRLRKDGLSIIETPESFCNHIKGVTHPKNIKGYYITMTSFKFSELYYFSKFDKKYVYRIYLHSFDFFFRIIINLILLRKYKVYSNLFRLIGVFKYIFIRLKNNEKN